VILRIALSGLPHGTAHFSDDTGLVYRSGPSPAPRRASTALLKTRHQLKGMTQRHQGGVDVVGAGVHPDAGLHRRVVRLLLLVVVFETLGKKGHGDTLGIGGTPADERERDTHQQDQQPPASNAYASTGDALLPMPLGFEPRREWHSTLSLLSAF